MLDNTWNIRLCKIVRSLVFSKMKARFIGKWFHRKMCHPHWIKGQCCLQLQIEKLNTKLKIYNILYIINTRCTDDPHQRYRSQKSRKTYIINGVSQAFIRSCKFLKICWNTVSRLWNIQQKLINWSFWSFW